MPLRLRAPATCKTKTTCAQSAFKVDDPGKSVENFLRDTRHLAGRSPKTTGAPPQHQGLALGLEHDPEGAPLLKVGTKDQQIHRISFHERIDLLVEEPRHCVGREQDERWLACPEGRHADRFTRCPLCHPLPVRECVFNPRCQDCPQEFCMSPHEVYVAYHGTEKKVGMTRKAREGVRLVEQGADLAFIVKEVADRFQARNLEDRITSLIGIPQVLSHKRRLARLARPVPQDAIEQDYERIAPRLERLTGSPPGPLLPMPQGRGRPLGEVPVPVATVGHHAGTAEGAHGRFLFYRADPDRAANKDRTLQGPIWALDLKEVVTHPVRYRDPGEQ